jgi:class 3 adenylate cyclase/tetratricopeptide (TPR) repeat protein
MQSPVVPLAAAVNSKSGTTPALPFMSGDAAVPDSHCWVPRTVLVLDVDESCRIMEGERNDTLRLMQLMEVAGALLTESGGRLVKRGGDGLLLEFDRAPPAVTAALAVRSACDKLNADMPEERHLLLRISLHIGEVIADRWDLYGPAVNLAYRLNTLAGPGEIVVSAAVRDELAPDFGAALEDLGDCYLKHVQQPVHAFRVGTAGRRPVIESGSSVMPELRPSLAVFPFVSREGGAEHRNLGGSVADELISALSRSSELRLLSRLQTAAFRTSRAPLNTIHAQLGVQYVVSGTYHISGNRLFLAAELAEAKSAQIVWSQSLYAPAERNPARADALVNHAVAAITTAITTRELQRSRLQALPNLESHTLLTGAVVLMHRGGPSEFGRARDMLQTLSDRARRQPAPHAWLAKWHVLRFNRGWSHDQNTEARLALNCSKRALDSDSQCTLALAIDGFVHTNLLKRLDIARERYELALNLDPDDALACLLSGTLDAFSGRGGEAVAGTERALRLAKPGPLRYFYESLAATAALAAGQYARAIELAQRSLRSNSAHTSTLRALAIAQSQLGHAADARRTVDRLLCQEPDLTVTKYLERSPGRDYSTGREWSQALRKAGLPA